MPRYSFPITARMTQSREFKQAFGHGLRQNDACFTLIACNNEQGIPRLGLVMARKNLRRAVDRNRVKRVVRESFRAHRAQLPARDFVVMARTAAGARPGAALRLSLAQHWKKITDACAR